MAQMTSSIGLCLGAVTVISALVLAHPVSVLIVIIVLGAWDAWDAWVFDVFGQKMGGKLWE